MTLFKREKKTTYGPLQQAEAMVYRRNVESITLRTGTFMLSSRGISDAVVGLEFKVDDGSLVTLPLTHVAALDFNILEYASPIPFQDFAAEIQMGSMLDIGDKVRLAYQTRTVEENGGLLPANQHSDIVVRSVATDLVDFSLRPDEKGYQVTRKR